MRLEIVIYVIMRYPLYNMTCDDFENLVVLICHYILGAAVSPFAKGKDGGKDGKFVGKANCFPSECASRMRTRLLALFCAKIPIRLT